jgi:hypothetical protein
MLMLKRVGILIGALVLFLTAVYADAQTVTRPTKLFGGTAWLDGEQVFAVDLNADVDTLYDFLNTDPVDFPVALDVNKHILLGTYSDTNSQQMRLDVLNTGPGYPQAYIGLPDSGTPGGAGGVTPTLNLYSTSDTITGIGSAAYAGINKSQLILWNAGITSRLVIGSNGMQIAPVGTLSLNPGGGAVAIGAGGLSVTAGNIATITSGTINTAGGGSDHSSTASCAGGYTRVGLWCLDTDGTLALLRTVAGTNEISDTTTAVNASATVALIFVRAEAFQNGSSESNGVEAAIGPGNGAAITTGFQARAVLGGEETISEGQVIVPTDTSGQVKTRCAVESVAQLTLARCSWYIAGYMD